MRSWYRLVIAGLAFSTLISIANFVSAQTTLGTFQLPVQSSKPALSSVSDWSKQVLEHANSSWTESNAAVRDRKLFQWAEQTPAQLAYVTRIIQQNDQSQTANTVQTLKELFGLIKRVNWQNSDQQHLQRIVASWSVVAPQLIKLIDSRELSATQRRILEQVLIDLATISRDAKIGSPLAQQTWQAQVPLLGQLSRHQKLSVKLVALGVLEAIGPDAIAARSRVQESLRDADRFVRWSAVRTLQSFGMDQTASQAVARLKNDEDAQVRRVAMEALSNNFTTTQARAETKQPVFTAPTTMRESGIPVSVHPVEPVRTESLATLNTPKANNRTNEAQRKDSLLTPSVPAALPLTLPDMPLKLPETKPNAPTESVPMFGPPPVSRSTKQTESAIVPVQLTSSVPTSKPVVPIDPASLWIPRLRQGTVDQQLQAVRELGKLGTGAAESVPLLAEYLLTADVSVRREIPMTLAKIGSPAKLATSVLERALQDKDTDVKVNAARALLELDDK